MIGRIPTDNKEFYMAKGNAPIKMRKLKDFSDTSGKRYKILFLCGILLGPLVWFLVTRWEKPSLFLSTPEAVWAVTVQRIQDGYFFDDIWASLKRVLSLCGASIPGRLFLELEEADRNSNGDVARICMDFTVDLISRLLIGGAPGIHLYTLNKADLCLDIVRECGLGKK